MEPLNIGIMQIDVYNQEESPLHQIVKKLIYRKILDLEPYNFNNVYPSGTSGLAISIFGEYILDKYDYKVREEKQKEIRETMTWDDPKIKILVDFFTEKSSENDRVYDQNPFQPDSRRATTYIPIKPYKNKVFMEYSFFINGLPVIPDITLMNDKGKPETVIEILYTSLPKAEKLIKYIESDLNVIFVFADQAIKTLSMDMACRREYFRFPIREAWLKDTPIKEKVSRAVNILLQKKLKADEFIISKNIIKNTQYDPNNKWKKDRMDIGLKFQTNERKKDLSHDMILMKETSCLIRLLRFMKKHTQENKMIIPEFKTDRRYER